MFAFLWLKKSYIAADLSSRFRFYFHCVPTGAGLDMDEDDVVAKWCFVMYAHRSINRGTVGELGFY